jgi:hypothetical protein
MYPTVLQHCYHRSSADSLYSGNEDLAREESPTLVRGSSHLQGSLQAPEADHGSAATDPVAGNSSHTTTRTTTARGVTRNSGTLDERGAENVGTPIDNKWDLIAAHERRFCFDHGEDEWLLEYADRWMYPNDFSFGGAEVTL